MPSIKEDLKNGSFRSVYLLWGEEDFLRDFYKKSLTDKTVDKATFDFNYKEYNQRHPDNDEVEDFLNSYPFMADKKLLYIKNSGLLKSASESDKKFWSKILSDVPDYAIIVFSETSVDKRNAIYKEINKSFLAEEFPLQKKQDLISWVSRYIGQYQKSMSADTIEYFLDCCTNKMYLLKNELEKLASFRHNEKSITRADIDKCCCKVPESTVWELIDDALAGKTKEAALKLGELKFQRQEPIPVNAAIFSKYSTLRKEKLLSMTLSSREIAAKTGQKEYFVKLHLGQIKNLSLEYFDKVLSLCAEADRRIKQGYADGWTEIEIIFSYMVNTK